MHDAIKPLWFVQCKDPTASHIRYPHLLEVGVDDACCLRGRHALADGPRARLLVAYMYQGDGIGGIVCKDGGCVQKVACNKAGSALTRRFSGLACPTSPGSQCETWAVSPRPACAAPGTPHTPIAGNPPVVKVCSRTQNAIRCFPDSYS